MATATLSAVRFTVSCFSSEEPWGAVDDTIADRHECQFISAAPSPYGDEMSAVTLSAPNLQAAEAYVTEMFGCDDSCTAEELMEIH
jgi:hypothetical protein